MKSAEISRPILALPRRLDRMKSRANVAASPHQ